MLRNSIVLGLAMASLPGTVASGPQSFGYSHTYREIQIDSDPTGASIMIQGHPLGNTPQAIRVDRKLTVIQMTLRKQGYLETVAKVDLTSLPEPVAVIRVDMTAGH